MDGAPCAQVLELPRVSPVSPPTKSSPKRPAPPTPPASGHRVPFLLLATLALAAVLFSSGYVSGERAARQSVAAAQSAAPAGAAAPSVAVPGLATTTLVGEWRARGELTHPLLECDTGRAETPAFHPMADAMRAYATAQEHTPGVEHVAVYFRDLNEGRWLGVNDELPFSPASLLKVSMLIAWLHYADLHTDALDRPLTVASAAADDFQNIRPTAPLEVGRSYPARELLEAMIVDSSNTATIALATGLDPRFLNGTFEDLGMLVPRKRPPEDFMSVREYASFFRVLYNASYLSQANSERALQILTKSAFKDGLVAGVPTGVRVAHKFGERVVGENKRQLHDCGIVYFPQHPYVLCVMTRGTSFDALKGAIRDAAALVYQQWRTVWPDAGG